MAETRDQSDGKKEEQAAVGEKHQTEHDSPTAKRTKTEKQSTIEESMGKASDEGPEDDVKKEDGKKEESDEKEEKNETQDNGRDDAKPAKGTAEVPSEEDNVPSNILEKGIIYFFIRGRVNIEEPSSVTDIQRSFMILRPIDTDAKLGEGTIGDAGNTRLLALPKKVFPQSGKDRFMIFVEKSGASFKQLKDEFLQGEDYETKTVGTRHTPAATPVGEGVYAITSTGNESHMAYMLTLPEKLDDVQKKLGLKEKGSFILSTKNPKAEGPANTQLPEGPDFPKKIMEEFRALRWMPSKPEHLDYPNAQVLLIGESSGIDKAVEPQEKDSQKPEELLEKLEEEDLERMKHLAGDDSAAIFQDLEARAKDYPKLQTTF
ncbi:BTB domain transcription factor [Sarocladium implicatum]|nr:BTB domain transcription factor [Sarocladium implicatum]